VALASPAQPQVPTVIRGAVALAAAWKDGRSRERRIRRGAPKTAAAQDDGPVNARPALRTNRSKKNFTGRHVRLSKVGATQLSRYDTAVGAGKFRAWNMLIARGYFVECGLIQAAQSSKIATIAFAREFHTRNVDLPISLRI
jgi:hypothetical protein